ncbi:magnesium/cobalt efflux protein [Sphingopyxis lindanitolerans]|uniref:Magnesium/cobalt efflux protein n=1 Tax=Sphingopyxis lindanitolerans TaxID=2054227 RepID=A0A2S8B1W6_9SPHN|nr:hemolysin family protein [Sphingopyxis lindanitolerans]PQM26340.1 magnesium/cobalt efflux protein [Sphingopyxis lindanitolerans]
MPDDRDSSSRSEDDSRSGLLAGLKTWLFGGDKEPSLREQIEEVIDEAEEEGDDRRGGNIIGGLSPIERKMVRNLLHFGEQTVDDVAVPRGEIVAIPESASFAEVIALFADAGHSRLPVYRETLDEVVGMIHVKDVFAVLAAGQAPPPLLDLIRQPLYVPQSMDVLDLLAEMRAKRTHLAIVIDEYSGTEGLVTFEDLVEEIVGEVEDEHDDEPTALFVLGETGCWEADARAELDDIGEAIDPRLADVEEDVDTLGGLSAVLAGHVPEVGEILLHPSGWRIEVTEADEKRVHHLRLHPPVEVDPEAPLDRPEDF